MVLKRELTTQTSSVLENGSTRASTSHVEVISSESPHADETVSPPLLPSTEKVVSLLSEPGVLDSVLLAPPEPLDPRGALVSVSKEVPPSSLDSTSHVVPVSISHGLESEEL